MKIRVNVWLKMFMYVVTVGPTAFFSIFLYRKISELPVNEDFWTSTIICFLLAISFFYLSLHLYSLCSIELDDKSICQRVFFQKGKFFQCIQLTWPELDKVSFKKTSYFFSAKDKVVEFNLSLFNDQNAMIEFVHKNLPERLRS